MIRITGLGDEVVYGGPGELISRSERMIIRQTQVHGDERRSRELDLTVFLEEVAGGEASWSVRLTVPTLRLPSLNEWAENPLRVPVPYEDKHWELHFGLPADSLTWLGRLLRESFETSDERGARHRAREENLRAALGFGPPGPQEAEAALNGVAEGLVQMRDALRAGAWLNANLTARLRNRSAEHDQLIESTRSEFPYDPLGYGRVYPGNAGTSRWTPPEDPDEKIRSCP